MHEFPRQCRRMALLKRTVRCSFKTNLDSEKTLDAKLGVHVPCQAIDYHTANDKSQLRADSE